MSLQPYVFPSSPSLQVKAVQKYLKYISEGDFDSLTSLVTDDYTLATSPSNMGVPTKTMKEEVVSLKALQSGIDGKPLAVTVYDVDDGPRKTWVHAMVHPVELEIMYCFQFGKGHNAHKISSLREFHDSKMYTELGRAGPSST